MSELVSVSVKAEAWVDTVVCMSRPAHADDPKPFVEGTCRSRPARLGEIEREEWVEIATAAGTLRVATSPSTKYLPDE